MLPHVFLPFLLLLAGPTEAEAIFCDSHLECDDALGTFRRYCDVHSGHCEPCHDCCQGEEYGVHDTCGSCACESSSSSQMALVQNEGQDSEKRKAIAELLGEKNKKESMVYDLCDWRHVSCDAQRRIVGIEARLANISGPLPDDVFYALPHLEVLDLGLNRINGTLPQSISSLSSLRYLALDYNYLAIDTLRLSRLTSLRSLMLQYNYEVISGMPPLFSLKRLQSLDLSSTGGSGLRVDGIHVWESLVVLRLNDASVSGTFNSSNLLPHTLKTLSVRSNRIEGTIPELGPAMQEADFGDNFMHGTVYRQSAASKLRTLRIDRNFFDSIQMQASDHPRLRVLDASLNEDLFTTSSSINNNAILRAPHITRLECAHCGLHGPLSSLLSTSMRHLNLRGNHLEGALNMLDGLKRLSFLDLSGNRLKGTFSPSAEGRRHHKWSYMDVSANALTEPVNRIILGKDSTALAPFRRTFTVCGTENDFFIQVLQDAGWTQRCESCVSCIQPSHHSPYNGV